MPRLRRNGGIGQIAPREGVVTLVEPEAMSRGGRGQKTPLGTRLHEHTLPAQPEPVRNGVRFVEYDPSPEARAARRRKYKLAWLALDRAEQAYGKRPQTIRGLPGAEAVRKRRRAGSIEGGDPAVRSTGRAGGRSTGSRGGVRAA